MILDSTYHERRWWGPRPANPAGMGHERRAHTEQGGPLPRSAAVVRARPRATTVDEILARIAEAAAESGGPTDVPWTCSGP